MAGNGVELKTNVVLGGQVTAGFNALAGKLEALGATVDRVGSYVRQFESDSVDVYRSYEDNMLAAEYALSAQYESASELAKVMVDLDANASAWAATTIFHTSDVSKAINEAAHAGWDYTRIVQGIPKAMLIAQAGSLELSEGVDYLVKMMGATKTEFGDIGKVIDQWAMAANKSATNIGEMGEAFMSLGSAAQFADSTAELFTMLGVMANVGTVGSQAGTQLRSAMMRIIAPTARAEDAMSMLGADAEELEEILGNASVTAAAKKLESLGFSAYDTNGNLKSMIQIFTELDKTLVGIDEKTQNEILSAIFPTRTIAQAKAFLSAVDSGEMQSLLQAITGSEGYAEKGAEIMMSGLTGSVETLNSKVEELQRKFGEVMAPGIETASGAIGSMVDAINGMDSPTFAGLVSGTTTLAAMGPVMLGASGIVKAFTALGLKGTAIVALAVGTGALVGYLHELNETEFRGNFGELELDLDKLGEHVDSIKTSFDEQQEAIATWENALKSAGESYASGSGALSEILLTDVLGGKQLTQGEIDNINQYAQSLYDAVWQGIENAEASDMTFLQAILGDAADAQGIEAGSTAGQVVNAWYSGLYDEARSIGEEIRRKMSEALQDGSLNEEERQAIQSSVDRYNQIMAEIQSQMDSEDYYRQLYKAQSVSWDTISDYVSENGAKEEEDLAALEETYAAKWAHFRAAYDYAIANGTEITMPDGSTRRVTEGDWGVLEAQLQAEKEQAKQGIIDKYEELNARALDAAMYDSDFSEGWALLRNAPVRDDGTVDTTNMFAGMTRDQLESVNEQLSWIWSNASRIQDQLPENFAYNADAENLISLMWNAREPASEALRLSEGLFMYGLDTVPYKETVELDTEDAERKAAELREQIDGISGEQTVTVHIGVNAGGNVDYMQSMTQLVTGGTYADGGRATEASIFGEAGPEWAIPEEHSERTAELLNAAREASGFSWGELLGRYGGLNANPGNQSVVVHYAPVITAQDASGMEEVLQEDKERLARLVRSALRDMKLRDEVEVYA